jgi:cobalt-zinc-cadmium efflux system membrane fusion protein
MRLRHLIRPLIVLLVIVGAACGAIFSRHLWRPYVFPVATAKALVGPTKEESESKDKIVLSEQAQKNLQLEVEQHSPREYWRTIVLPGAVVDRPGESDRGVNTRVAGVVADIKARPGDTVKPGDSLFTLQLVSEFAQTSQSDLHKVSRELQFATEKRNRIAKQVEEKTTPGSALIEEENQVKRITTQVQSHRRQLSLFGFTPSQIQRAEAGEVVTEVTISAPGRPGTADSNGGTVSNAGDALYEVQELKVRLGDQVLAGQSLCILADHQRLLVEGWAFKSEAKALAIAAERRLPIRAEFADEHPGDWQPIEPLSIHHLSNQVDPVSRTFSFFLTIDNQGQTFTRDGKTFFVWRFRPGQRVRLKIPIEKFATPGPDGKTEALPFVLPASAIVREGPEVFIFVQSGDVFIRKPVRVLYEDRTDAVIANDGCITEADYIVRNEAAAINRAMKTGAGDGD